MDRPGALGEDPEAVVAEDLTRGVLDLLEVLGALDEDVADRKRIVERERRVVAAGADLLGQILRGMSSRSPQPSPSPSTFPARCSII